MVAIWFYGSLRYIFKYFYKFENQMNINDFSSKGYSFDVVISKVWTIDTWHFSILSISCYNLKWSQLTLDIFLDFLFFCSSHLLNLNCTQTNS